MKTAQEPLTGPLPQKGHLQDALFAGQEVPPPCSAQHPQDRDLSKDSTSNFNRSRCQFTYSDGRRCGNERAPLCVHHGTKQSEVRTKAAPDATLSAPELVSLCSDLTTATNINRALARVFLLTAQGRISQKQAVAFGYLSQLLLQTVPGIRSEFVSAFGYHPWEAKLKTSLTSKQDENIVPSGAAEDDEPEEGAPVNKARLSAQSLREGLTPADWDSLYHRGRDLLAGKYSVTPEGRREAEALNTDLELLQPPAAKMPKGARASIIEHMKRWIAQKKVTMRPASSSRANNVSEGPLRSPAPPALNYYGHPIPMAVPYDEVDRSADFPSRAPSPRTSPPTDKLSPPPNSEISNIKSPVAPVSPPSSRPSAPAPAVSSDRPPTRRPKKPRRSAQTPSPEPSPRPSPPAFPPELDLTPPNRTAHATDWYTPPAWSKNRTSDPFPNRNEKRKRELRSMSNSKLRHLQHLNSRAF